jgi:hypothetical protein
MAECDDRAHRRSERRIKAAAFPRTKSLPAFDYDAHPNIDPAVKGLTQTVAVAAHGVRQGPIWHDDVGETCAPPGPLTAYGFPMTDLLPSMKEAVDRERTLSRDLQTLILMQASCAGRASGRGAVVTARTSADAVVTRWADHLGGRWSCRKEGADDGCLR